MQKGEEVCIPVTAPVTEKWLEKLPLDSHKHTSYMFWMMFEIIIYKDVLIM